MADNIMETIKIKDLLPILDGISDAVFIDGGDGHFIWCNSACEELYQISYADAKGTHVEDLEKMGIFAPSVTRRVLDENREITIIHENKNGKKLLTTGTPLYNGHKEISLIITVSRDITRLTEDNDSSEPDAGKLLQLNDIDGIEAPGGDIISSSQTMQNVMLLTKRLASVNTTVLITGESGVGKGLIAKQLHEEGNRCDKPFVTVNCGAIPDNLIESELFGYAPGAFTGSRADGKKGLFEVAQNGTIFLDEISELPLNMQVKLLRVIQEREITPVGGVKPIPIDVRIVSATNRDLEELVRQDKFREDLYYRLNVVPITIPPLRDRPGDIVPFAYTFLQELNKKYNFQKHFSPSALRAMEAYDWPGNVRELKNVVERMVILSQDDLIRASELPFQPQRSAPRPGGSGPVDLKLEVARLEDQYIRQAYEKYKNVRDAAASLGMDSSTFVRKRRRCAELLQK